MANKRTKVGLKSVRDAELKRILLTRRQEIVGAVHDKMRDVAESGEGQDVLDSADSGATYFQNDIDLALIQMRSETLDKIDQALLRLAKGGYGKCFECGNPINERRLRALPFAVRCKACEEIREPTRRR